MFDLFLLTIVLYSRARSQEDQTYAKRAKRKYQKRKERERIQQHIEVANSVPALPVVQLPQYSQVEVLQEPYSSEEEMSPVGYVGIDFKRCVAAIVTLEFGACIQLFLQRKILFVLIARSPFFSNVCIFDNN